MRTVSYRRRVLFGLVALAGALLPHNVIGIVGAAALDEPQPVVTPSALYALCNAAGSATACTPGASITVAVSVFPKNTLVHLWWLDADPDDPTVTDCTQPPGALGRTALGDVTTDGSGNATSATVQVPPPGGTPAKWSYGTNWICATTSSGPGTIGQTGHAPFVVA